MKSMRSMLALLLAAIWIIGSCPAALAEEASYPTQWDLTQIYADAQAWQADYEEAMSLLSGYEDFRGSLNTVDGLYDLMTFFTDSELTRLENKLYLYAYLGTSLDPSDPAFSQMMTQLNSLFSLENQYRSYIDPEIYALPMETRRELMSDPRLEPWAYALSSYLDPENEPLSEDALSTLAILSPGLGLSESIYLVLANVDLPSPTITMPDGTQVELTDAAYSSIIYSAEYDRNFKLQCQQAYADKYQSFQNTFASLLNQHVTQTWAEAQLDGYSSSREAAMHETDVDPAVYDLLIEAAHEGAADYQRYLDAHRRALGLEEQYAFDLYTPVSDYERSDIAYADAVSEVREALSVLGEDYLEHYDEIIQGGHVDVYPAENKDTGAFSLQVGVEYEPYVLLNYLGYATDVSTIAHEMGHAIYSSYSAENQNLVNASPGIFTQEVASTTNELIYLTDRIRSAQTDDEKLFYLETLLQTFSGTFFTQMLYAEFEDYLFKTVEAGGALNAEALSEKYAELVQLYRGDTVTQLSNSSIQWAMVPHFYYNYYVYQYASSIAYASSICQKILEGTDAEVENYLVFLQQGSSASPAELLAIAGVDPLDPQTYKSALEYFSGLVDEYELLTGVAAG